MQKSFSKILLASAGFACFLAMNSFSLWNFSLLPEAILGADARIFWSIPLSYGNALTFFAFVIGAYKFPRLVNRSPFTITAFFLALALVLLSGFMVLKNMGVLFAAGLCMGIGTTCAFFCWARAFYADGVVSAKIEIVLGSVLSAVPFLAFMALDGSAVVFTLGLLALLNLTALFFHLRMTGKEARDSIPYKVEPLKKVLGITWKTLLCLVVVGITSPVILALAHEPLRALTFSQQSLMVHSENIIAVVLLGVVWLALKKDLTIVKAFTFLFPVLITALLLFPFMEPSMRIIVPYVSGTAFVVFSILVVMESLSVSSAKSINFTVVYGLFAGSIYLAHQLGNSISELINEAVLFQETSAMIVLFVLLYGLSIAMFFVLRRPVWNNKIEGEEGGNTASAPVDVIDLNCNQLIEKHRFSERQAEVLLLLAHGYDVPTIAKKLFLSENTVKTHTKKLYTALDVHSRQEIIELGNARAED